jgi:hypothetical protein
VIGAIIGAASAPIIAGLGFAAPSGVTVVVLVVSSGVVLASRLSSRGNRAVSRCGGLLVAGCETCREE